MSIDEAKINLDNLQIDKVLASYDGPMLFVNKDADGNYYLAYCCDVDEDEYVIAATSVRDLITMLENDKTVYSVFQKSSNKWKVHSDSSVERVAKFNDLDLLDGNVYLKNLGGSFEDYAEQLRSEEQTCAKRIIVHLVRDEYSRILTFNENYKPFFSLEKFSKEPVSKKFNVWHSNKIVREAQECLV